MARLIVWNLLTLDGYFEGAKKWDLDFHNRAWGPELEKLSEEFGRKAGTLVFGRVTYEGMKAHWTSAASSAEPGNVTDFMNALPKLVASRTLTSSDWNNTRVTSDIEGELTRLKASSDKDIYVFGSAVLTRSLLDAGLVDELMLCHVPVLLGEGTPFFKPGKQANLALIDVQKLANGSLITRYEVRRA